MSVIVVARWESRSGKHWVELEWLTRTHYGYRANGSGGLLASGLTREAAIAEMKRRVDAGLFQPDNAKTPMRRSA
jgi:hypothetical protein